MSRTLTIRLPSLVGTKEFRPTGLQIQCLCGFIESLVVNKEQEPTKILTGLGRADTNWYGWLKKDGFLDWWNQAIEEYFTGHGLREVHKAVYRRALGNSPQDAKTYLDRFDKDFKPATKEEHSFPGLEPPKDLPGALERSKERAKLVASEVVENGHRSVQDGRTPDGDKGNEA